MNNKANFIHLHVHSDYSLLESTASVMVLADRTEELEMEYLALTDNGNMFGIMEFLDACKVTVVEHGSLLPRKNPIKPIIGCEVNVTPGSRFEKKGNENENQFYHLVLLAANQQGYLNLVKLCSLAYTEGFHYRPHSMNYLERFGIIKFDFLGLKTLDVIKNTVELIRRRGAEYDSFLIENIPEDDAATFKLLAEGNTFGVFQFESDGIQGILKKAKPTNINDLIAINSLYRPGAMDQLPRFIAAKNDEERFYYPAPELEDVLKETYGVIVYQEQVMKIVNIIAGYTLGEADNFRRALGKKIPELTEKERERFISSGIDRGCNKEKTQEIFELLNNCAGYCFNKSHAAAYALIAYQCAYLKANFPAEFLEVTLSCESKS